MTEREFFLELSSRFGGSALGPFAALLLFAALLAAALLLALAHLRARRERDDALLVVFLAARHRLLPFELDEILRAARAARMSPPLLPLADPASFERIRPRLRAALVARLQIEPQADELLADLQERLFRA